MSQLYIRLRTGFYTHVKTLRLKARIGKDALWLVPRIWAFAAENQPDGDMSRYSAEELAMLVSYEGDAQAMLVALKDCGYMDSDGKIHDWNDHNGYHQKFSNRASVAAKARWAKKESPQTPQKEDKDKDKDREPSIASSIAQASGKHNAPDKSRTNSLNAFESAKGKLYELYRRPIHQRMTGAEESQLAEICRRDGFDGEISRVVSYRSNLPVADKKYFPQSMARLLSAWDEVLDRANLQPEAKPNLSSRELDNLIRSIDAI